MTNDRAADHVVPAPDRGRRAPQRPDEAGGAGDETGTFDHERTERTASGGKDASRGGGTSDDANDHSERPSISERVEQTLQSEQPATDGAGTTTQSDGFTDDVAVPRECQNCGDTENDPKPRALGPEGLTAMLCKSCHVARARGTSSVEECRKSGLPVETANADTCESCDAPAKLEAHAIVPLNAGGHRHENNVLGLCQECHAAIARHPTLQK